MWVYPDQPKPSSNTCPTVDPYFRLRVFLWFPVKMLGVHFRCPQGTHIMTHNQINKKPRLVTKAIFVRRIMWTLFKIWIQWSMSDNIHLVIKPLLLGYIRMISANYKAQLQSNKNMADGEYNPYMLA